MDHLARARALTAQAHTGDPTTDERLHYLTQANNHLLWYLAELGDLNPAWVQQRNEWWNELLKADNA